MYDPQNAPSEWWTRIATVTAADGNELSLVEDQDGETFVVSEEL